MWLDLVRFD